MKRAQLAGLLIGGTIVLWQPGDLGVVLGLLAGLLASRVLANLVTGEQDRSDAVRAEQLPIALDVMSLGLDAGLAWHRSVGYAAACVDPVIAEPLLLAAHRLELGARAGEVWTGAPALLEIGEVISRSERSGSAVSDLLRQSADALRARTRAERLARAKRLGVTVMGPVTLCFLPAFIVLGLVPLIGSMLGELQLW